MIDAERTYELLLKINQIKQSNLAELPFVLFNPARMNELKMQDDLTTKLTRVLIDPYMGDLMKTEEGKKALKQLGFIK